MSIPIIDQLRPLGNFPAVDASDVQAGNQRLSTVLSNTPSTTYVDNVVSNKVDKVEGKGLSTNDFANTYKSKLDGLDNALAAKANTSDVTSGLAGKVDKETGKGLSTNDYTTTEKNKLAGIEAQANKTTVDSALSSSSTNPVQNKVVKEALDEQNSDLVTGLALKANTSTVSALSSRVTDVETEQTALDARMDAFTNLSEGSTTGDAELIDGRVGADGTTYANIGGAIRGQITQVEDNLSVVENSIINSITSAKSLDAISNVTKVTGKYDNGAGLSDGESYDTYQFIALTDAQVYFSKDTNYYISITVYSDSTMTSAVVPRKRHQAREENWNGVPLISNKMTIEKGNFVSISINNWNEITKFYTNSISEGSILNNNVKLNDGQKAEIGTIVNTAIAPVSAKANSSETAIAGIQSSIYADSIYVSGVSDVVKRTGTSASAITSGVMLEENVAYDTYYFITDKSASLYFESVPSYTSVCYGTNYSGIEPHTNHDVLLSSNAVRYRTTDNNLPYKNNKINFNSNSVLAVTIPSDMDVRIYGYESDYQEVNEEFKDQVVKKPKVIYKADATLEDTTERLEVFIPTDKGYVRYDFVHSVNVERNADIWRVNNAYAVNENLESRFSLTAGGEWEVAVHLNDREDFSGGILHGDQKETSVIFMLDGLVVNPVSITEATDFEKLRVVTVSNLYDPADGTTVIAVDGCEHVFTVEGLTINQSLVWQNDESITNCYLAMFPVKKSMTTKYYTDSDFVPASLTSTQRVDDANNVVLYSDDKGMVAEFTLEKYPELKELYITDNGTEFYNKCYYVIQHNGSVTSGDKWRSSVKYNFTVSA